VQEESKETIQAVAKKRAEKKSSQGSEKSDVPNFGKKKLTQNSDGFENVDKTANGAVSYKVVQEWFLTAMARNNLKWVPSGVVNDDGKGKRPKKDYWWNAKDITCAAKLVALYGGEDVQKAICWLCDNWENMKKNSDKITGSPNIGFLYSFRERVFADAREGRAVEIVKKKGKKKLHMVGEYDAESCKNSPRIGW
jgi:hypothetical protein